MQTARGVVRALLFPRAFLHRTPLGHQVGNASAREDQVDEPQKVDDASLKSGRIKIGWRGMEADLVYLSQSACSASPFPSHSL